MHTIAPAPDHQLVVAVEPGRAVTFVVAGLLDEAPDYVDALIREVEASWRQLTDWWSRWGNGPLELRGELWGAGSSTRLQHDDSALRCLLQRAPESTWDGADPRALARDDLAGALLLISRTSGLPALTLSPAPTGAGSPGHRG